MSILNQVIENYKKTVSKLEEISKIQKETIEIQREQINNLESLVSLQRQVIEKQDQLNALQVN